MDFLNNWQPLIHKSNSLVFIDYFLLLLLLLLLLILATSTWGLSELWGGGFPTSDIDHSESRLRHLLLRTLIEPAPTSPPAIQCPIYPAFLFCLDSAKSHPPTRASPVSIPSYQENPATIPSLNFYQQRPNLPILPHPHQAFQITVAASPTILPKYLLDGSLAAVPQPSVTETSLPTSPLPRIPSPSHRTQILAVGLPNPILSPDSCHCIPKEVCSLLPGSPYPSPTFSKYHPSAFEPSPPSPALWNSHLPPWVFQHHFH